MLIMSRQITVVLSSDNGFLRLNRDINDLICKLTLLDKDNKLSLPKTLISFRFHSISNSRTVTMNCHPPKH